MDGRSVGLGRGEQEISPARGLSPNLPTEQDFMSGTSFILHEDLPLQTNQCRKPFFRLANRSEICRLMLMEYQNALAKSLNNSGHLFSTDLEALPEEAFSQSFGPKCRTVADITYECMLVNDHIGLTIRGEELFDWPEGYIKAPEDFVGKAAIIDAFKQSMQKQVDTANTFNEEGLTGKVMSDGQETTFAERFRFMNLHLWYHLGQLNFIQTMLGDDAWHWH